MEKKLKIVLMSALLISLLVVTYFIIFNSFIEMFDLNLRDTLAILSSIFSLFGIIIAASVAIYVMNKNHRENETNRIKNIKHTDYIREKQAFIRFGDILHLSTAMYKTFEASNGTTLSEKEVEYLKYMLDSLELHLKENLEIEIYNQDIYKNIINASDYINNQIRVLNSMILLRNNTLNKVQKETVMDYFRKIQNTAYDEVRRNKEFIFKEDITKI